MKVITIANQKGGVGKTTASGITAHLLSEQGYRVLCVDCDSQGNLTEFLTGEDCYEFNGSSLLEAIEDLDATEYVVKLSENLHLIPSEELMATLPKHIYTEFIHSYKEADKDIALMLSFTLKPVLNNYDYVIIDAPPALSEITLNALTLSDYVVVPYEPSKFCYSALPRFLKTVQMIQSKSNPDLKVAGILRTITDPRATDVKVFLTLVEQEYGDMLFDAIIPYRAKTRRLTFDGFDDNPDLKEAIEHYLPFFKELMDIVEHGQNDGKSTKETETSGPRIVIKSR